MLKMLRSSLCQTFLAVALLAASNLTAQQTPATAPVPIQILNAHKVFISNAGGDASSQYTYKRFGIPGQAYGPFYLALQSWGHYELVPTPADADLVFQIRSSVVPTGPFQFELTILDAKTHFILWVLTEPVESANRKVTFLKNFDKAMDASINDIKSLSAPAAATGDPVKK